MDRFDVRVLPEAAEALSHLAPIARARAKVCLSELAACAAGFSNDLGRWETLFPRGRAFLWIQCDRLDCEVHRAAREIVVRSIDRSASDGPASSLDWGLPLWRHERPMR